MDLIERLIFYVLLPFAILVVLLTFLLIVPFTLHTQAQCLESGYPEARVTWKLDRYCMNLDGTVTVKVDKIGD